MPQLAPFNMKKKQLRALSASLSSPELSMASLKKEYIYIYPPPPSLLTVKFWKSSNNLKYVQTELNMP